MADGNQELLELDAEFLEDLKDVFDERADEFSSHLRSMLLELWSRARGRPGSVDQELERLRELKQQKDELRELVKREFKQQLPAVAEQFRSQIESVMVGIFDSHLAATLNSGRPMTDEALCCALERVLDVLGLSLVNCGSRVQLFVDGTSSSIPMLEPGDSDDDWQLALKKRLEREGLLRPDPDWVPVYVHRETGRQVGIEETESIRFRCIETLLTTTNNGATWIFPNPQPIYNGLDPDNRVIELWTDEHPTFNASCTWHHTYDAGRGCEVITEVQIPGASYSSIVRARYMGTVTRYGLTDLK